MSFSGDTDAAFPMVGVDDPIVDSQLYHKATCSFVSWKVTSPVRSRSQLYLVQPLYLFKLHLLELDFSLSVNRLNGKDFIL